MHILENLLISVCIHSLSTLVIHSIRQSACHGLASGEGVTATAIVQLVRWVLIGPAIVGGLACKQSLAAWWSLFELLKDCCVSINAKCLVHTEGVCSISLSVVYLKY